MTVTLRFAPSPTGYLHVGGQRTALYNYLFAKKHGGKFILRIEDTDQSRYVEGAVENLMNSLSAMGLQWDKGPGKEDESGPYFQSKRLDIYHKEIDKLLSAGNAYRCFCSSERLEKLRNEQMAAGEPSGYDKKCRSIDSKESAKRAENEPFVVRMKIPDSGDCEIKDLVRGESKVAWSTVDDQILLKSDNFPTYHFANVVDDHYMGISHVIRGEEWLPSLPKHLLLYKFFAWKSPEFAHLPLLLNQDRSKLSKRQGDVAVEDYLTKGYLPETLNNFLALLGWNPGTEQEIFSMDELIESFDLDRVNKAGAVFDKTKLNWMNSQYIQKMDMDNYLEYCRKFADMSLLNTDRADIAFKALKTALDYFGEINEKLKIFYEKPQPIDNEDAREILNDERIPILFTAYLKALDESENLTADSFKIILKSIQKEYKKQGIKGKYLWMPIRLALTSEMHGPELPALAEYLGLEENKKRVKEALKR